MFDVHSKVSQKKMSHQVNGFSQSNSGPSQLGLSMGQGSTTKSPLGGKLFSTEGLVVKYGETLALNSVDFKIHQGEIVFLTGVSGAGKTTLLKVLGGLVEPHQGRVTRPDSRRVFTAPIFQDLRLFPDQTCYKNLEFAYDSTIYKDRKEFEDDLIELAKILGVFKRLDVKIRDANGGLKQKVAFMRALLTRPDVILADEPTASLDYENAKKMFDILNLYNIKQGLTVIWATHNRELVKKFTGRMVHMDKGRLIYSGHACFI